MTGTQPGGPRLQPLGPPTCPLRLCVKVRPSVCVLGRTARRPQFWAWEGGAPRGQGCGEGAGASLLCPGVPRLVPVGGGVWPQGGSRPRKLRMGPDVEGVGLRGQRSGPRNLGPGQGSPHWTPSSASPVRRQTRASHGTGLPRVSVGRRQCAPRTSMHFGGSPHWDGPRALPNPPGRPHPFPSAKWGNEAEDGLERWWQVSLLRGGPSPWPLSPTHTCRDPSLSPASVAGCVDAETPRWVGTAGGPHPGIAVPTADSRTQGWLRGHSDLCHQSRAGRRATPRPRAL